MGLGSPLPGYTVFSPHLHFTLSLPPPGAIFHSDTILVLVPIRLRQRLKSHPHLPFKYRTRRREIASYEMRLTAQCSADSAWVHFFQETVSRTEQTEWAGSLNKRPGLPRRRRRLAWRTNPNDDKTRTREEVKSAVVTTVTVTPLPFLHALKTLLSLLLLTLAAAISYISSLPHKGPKFLTRGGT